MDVKLAALNAHLAFPARFAHKLTNGKFQKYKHVDFISTKIAQSIFANDGRVIVEMPPRHGKSELISKWLPVWFLNLWPHKNVILCSYEADFAANWGRHVRNLIEEHGLKCKLSKDSSAANRFHTEQGGGMITAGVGGPITGRGGQLIIIDDPVKNWVEASSGTIRQRQIDWFQSALYSRLEPGGSIVVLMQRWHQGDLAGWLQSEHSDKWNVIRLPAIAEENDPLGRAIGDALCPERYDLDRLDKIKKSAGSYFWSSMYQQRPTPAEGGIIKREWLQYYDALPDGLSDRTQFWDLTFKDSKDSDFVVGGLWAKKGPDFYLIDRVRGQWDFPRTINEIKRFSEKHHSNSIVIEDKANGPAVISTLRQTCSGIIPFNPEGSKDTRLYSVSPLFEGGNVWLPRSAPWVGDYVEELVGFPNMPNDDQVDMTTMALLRLRGQNAPRVWNLS